MVKLLIISLVALLSAAGLQGALECEELAIEDCAYSVSGTGARCVLEKRVDLNNNWKYECQTSPVLAEKPEAWIETEDCLSACGLQRMAVGMSTDGLVQREFLKKWCSPACQESCPNIVDLFGKLAAGEDVHLPHICNFLRPKSRKLIAVAGVSKGTWQAIESLEAAVAPAGVFSTSALAPANESQL